MATLVKLLRVLLLAPVVVVAALVIRALAGAKDTGGQRPPLVPVFVIGFVGLAALGSAGLLPAAFTTAASEGSRRPLLIAIGSVGVKTQPQDILKVGAPAAVFLLAETVFLAIFIILGLALRAGVPPL